MLRADIKNKFIGELIKNGHLTREQWQTLGNFESLGELEAKLKANGWLEPEELAKAKAKYFKLPYADLVGEKIKPETLKLIPKELAESYQSVAYDKDRNRLSVGLVEPTDLKAKEAIEFLARERGLKIIFSVISKHSFDEALKQHLALKSEVEEYLGVAQAKLKRAEAGEGMEETGQLEEQPASAPIAKMVSVILRHAVEERASDIHIEPIMNQTRVRYRIDGSLKTSLVLPKYIHDAIVSRIKVMAKLKIDETRVPQDGRIRLAIDNKDTDFRVSTLPLYRQEKVVMRILDSSQNVVTLESLGFEGKNLEVINNNINKAHGMFLVTGPTGSGKTTTLYAALHILNHEDINIVTLEDPVEYFYKGINQSQINPDVGLTFASGLRSILRQDPDIVMVGEIRDRETADLAVHAALTGHIVLSTLHTNDAFGAIPRLLDLKVEPFLLASTINVVIAQRLVRKICADCQATVVLPKKVIKEMLDELKNIKADALPGGISLDKEPAFWQGQGCHRCGSTGYRGRSAIAEVLVVDDQVKALINEHKDWQKVKGIFAEKGMVTLKQDGIIKALKGITTIAEVLRATND